MTAYEYRRATWEEVCALGPQGWRLVAVPPIAEVKNVLGQQQMGEPLYAVERELSPQFRAMPSGHLIAVEGGEPPTSSGVLP